MNPQGVAAPVPGGIRKLPRGLRDFAQLERILGALLAFAPLLLVLVDSDIRGSISAYHDVDRPWAFYVPLTVGAMLFAVNGIVRDAHAYNTWLGVALFGVILFDHDGATQWPHAFFAIAFFVGNFVVMWFYSADKPQLVKLLLGSGIAGSVAMLLLNRETGLFWAEWMSLVIVAAHYILASVAWTDYRALRPTEKPKLMPPDPVAEAS